MTRRIVSLSRSVFSAGVFCSLAAAPAVGVSSVVGGARSGPWCRELTKTARNNIIDFSLHVLDTDKIFSLAELIGRPVWIQFFTTWCGPCNVEASDINRIAAKYGDAIAVAGINVKETPDKVRAFRDRHNVPFTLALDSTGNVFKQLGFREFPTHVFFDRNGMISCISMGDLTPAQMDNEIAVALQAKPLAQPAAPSLQPVPLPRATSLLR